MKPLAHSVSLIVAFLIGCVAAPVIVPPLSAQNAAAGATRWEYTCYQDAGFINAEQLNEYGAQGWELVGPRDEAFQFCFKRPL